MESTPGCIRQRANSGNEVSVYVSLRHMGNSNAIGSCRARVLGDIGIGVDDDCFACLLASDQVARLRQILVVKASKKHQPFGDGGRSVAG